MSLDIIELQSNSPAATRAIAAVVADISRAGDLIVLAGRMGAGKTAFAQGFAMALGVREPVTSPTYTLVHSYQAGRATLHHADLYRLEHTGEVDDLALAELLDERSIMIVEWGDVVDLGPHLLVELRLDEAGDDDAGDDEAGDDEAGDDEAGDDGAGADEGRIIAITSTDRRWAPRWERLEAALRDWAAA